MVENIILFISDESSKLLKRTWYTPNTYDSTIQPLETFNTINAIKCFTFFSYITSQAWKDIRIDFLKFTIYIGPNYTLIAPHMIEKYYLSLHSPKNIPIFEYGTSFIEVKPNRENSITFNKLNVNLKNSITCHDDDDEYSSSECIDECVLENIQNKYGRKNIVTSTFLLRKKYSKLLKNFDQSYYVRPNTTDLVSEFKPECMKQCKPDCSFEYYIYDIKAGRKISNQEYERRSTIFIYHKQIPDIYIKHIPETTFISFISNFGGLLGMWLGISVIMIFENIYHSLKQIHKIFSKPKTTNLFIQNIYFNNRIRNSIVRRYSLDI